MPVISGLPRVNTKAGPWKTRLWWLRSTKAVSLLDTKVLQVGIIHGNLLISEESG